MTGSEERDRLEWPDLPKAEWDDLDWIIAECVHERDCSRWPHRVLRHVTLHGSWSWNRWAGNIAHLLCDRMQPVPNREDS